MNLRLGYRRSVDPAACAASTRVELAPPWTPQEQGPERSAGYLWAAVITAVSSLMPGPMVVLMKTPLR